MKKKILPLLGILAVGAHAHAQTFFINLGPNGSSFTGSASQFTDADGSVFSSSDTVVNPDATNVYDLGSGLTLTLHATGSYSFAPNDGSVAAVTGSFLYQKVSGPVTESFTLTGLSSSDTVTFEFLGSSQPFYTDVNIAAGSTAPAAATAGTNDIGEASGASPEFTQFTDSTNLTGSTAYSGTFSEDRTENEGDVAAMVIKITAATSPTSAPEPSTWALFGASLAGGAAFLSRMRRVRAC